jgi:hypothetical protein
MSSESSNIAKYLESKRAGIERLTPKEAHERLQKNERVILVDTRPASFRDEEGSVPGAVIIERWVRCRSALTRMRYTVWDRA